MLLISISSWYWIYFLQLVLFLPLGRKLQSIINSMFQIIGHSYFFLFICIDFRNLYLENCSLNLSFQVIWHNMLKLFSQDLKFPTRPGVIAFYSPYCLCRLTWAFLLIDFARGSSILTSFWELHPSYFVLANFSFLLFYILLLQVPFLYAFLLPAFFGGSLLFIF